MPKIPGAGLVKGLSVTFKTMLETPVTVQYPHDICRAPASEELSHQRATFRMPVTRMLARERGMRYFQAKLWS